MKNKSLTVKYDLKELGHTLIEKAKESEREGMEKLVVGGVRNIMADISKSEDQIRKLQERVKLQKERLDALSNGEFEIDHNYELQSPTVRFNDEKLRGSL